MNQRRIMTAVICALLSAISLPAAAQEGGWSKAKTNNPEVVAAAKFAVTAAREKHEKIVLRRIVEAKQQLVAGMNYWVRLQVIDRSSGKAVRREAEAVVYRNLDDKQSLTSWKWREAKKKKEEEGEKK